VTDFGERYRDAIEAGKPALIDAVKRGWTAASTVEAVLLAATTEIPCPRTVWACGNCGPSLANTATWCALGCGRDYNQMNRVDCPYCATSAVLRVLPTTETEK
jgi:hypothetical protein